jgi:hypothetical protein
VDAVRANPESAVHDNPLFIVPGRPSYLPLDHLLPS